MIWAEGAKRPAGKNKELNVVLQVQSVSISEELQREQSIVFILLHMNTLIDEATNAGTLPRGRVLTDCPDSVESERISEENYSTNL